MICALFRMNHQKHPKEYTHTTTDHHAIPHTAFFLTGKGIAVYQVLVISGTIHASLYAGFSLVLMMTKPRNIASHEKTMRT